MFKRLFLKNIAKPSKRIYDNKENYSHSVYGVKSNFLRTFLICEYQESTGFGFQKNESEVVYDKRCNSSPYVEVAVHM